MTSATHLLRLVLIQTTICVLETARRSLLASLILITASSCVAAMDETTIDEFLREHLETVPIPGFSAVIVSGDEVVYQKGFGIEQVGSNEPMTPQSSVAIGSLTKSLTAVAIMQLVERGRVDLEAPITRYLPWFRTADGRHNEVRIQHLLHNTSGITSIDRWLFNLNPSEDAMQQSARALASSSLTREPGKSFEYCNENWILLGLVIAEVSGQPYSEFMQQEVLQPLGMTRSTTARKRLAELRTIPGHYSAAREMRVASLPFLGEALPAGSAMRASAEDLGKYLIMLLNGGEYRGVRLLQQKSVDQIFTPKIRFRVDLPEMGLQGEHASYAAGWIVADIDGREVIHHGGDAIVMGSWTMLDLDRKLAASVLYNGPRLDAYRFSTKLWLVNNLLHLSAQEPVSRFGLPRGKDPTSNDFTLPSRVRSRYAGKYVSADGFRVDIHAEASGGERLVAQIDSGAVQEQFELDFLSPSAVAFRNLTGSRTANFTLTAAGEVTGLVGGLPGGRFRKVTANGASRMHSYVAPDGSIKVRLPPGWDIRWEGITFEARSPAASNVFLQGGRNISKNTPSDAAVVQTFQTEMIGGRSWQRAIWRDAKAQNLLLTTQDSHGMFQLVLSTPHGQLTSNIRDLLLPVASELIFARAVAVTETPK